MTILNSECITPHEKPFDGIVRTLQEQDLPSIRPILETWIRNMDTREIIHGEVEETFQSMKESISGNTDRTYFVAQTNEGQVIGIVGIKPPDKRLIQYTQPIIQWN